MRLLLAGLVEATAATTMPPVPRRILVPLDGSATAEAALPIARALAQVPGAALTLLRGAQAHLEPKPRPVEEGLAGIREAETYLTEIRRQLVAGGAGQVAVSV